MMRQKHLRVATDRLRKSDATPHRPPVLFRSLHNHGVAQRATALPERINGPDGPRFLDQVANASRVRDLAYRNPEVESNTGKVFPKRGAGRGTERSPEWLVVGFSDVWTSTVPLVDRSGQVVARQRLQRGPESAVGPGSPHYS